VAVLGYAGYAFVTGPDDLMHPARSSDCRTPTFAYGWAYEAINYDASGDAGLMPLADPVEPDRWSCAGRLAPAGGAVRSADGVPLAGWYVPAAESIGPEGPTVLLVHGRSSNKSEYLRYAEPLHEFFNVVLVDTRDAGQSGAAPETMGVREALDVEAFVDWLVQTKRPMWIAVVGTSQGGAAALGAAAVDPRIRAVVLDSTHARIGETIGRGIERDRGLPAFPAQPAAFLGVLVRIGVDLNAADPVDVIPRLGDRPLLLVHGGRDAYDPPLDSAVVNLRAAIAAGVPVEFRLCQRAGHDAVIDECPDEWARWVTTFLQESVDG
jgi:pimeloyl-ACP methyl ester carboxylesterase